MVDLSIIILSYNTKKLLRECLLSIKKHGVGTQKYEIIVVDNASTDGSAQEIKNLRLKMKDDEVKLKTILNKKNLGYSKANNQGVRIASGRYLLFLNADTLVYPKTLEIMVNFMNEHKEVGAATCFVQLANGRLDDSCHRGFPTPWRAFCHFMGLAKLFPKIPLFSGYSMSYKNLNSIHEIDSCSGAFMLVRREAGEEIARLPTRQGWWDEDFFWYGEDLDFCYRLKEKDWQVYFVPEAKILHYKGVSGGIKKISQRLTRATRETRLKVTNARFNAMRIFYKKHYIDKYPKLVTWLVMQGVNFKHWLTLKTL